MSIGNDTVIIIIGILAAIAIPAFLSQRNNAQQKAAQANLRNAATAQQSKFTETGSFTDDVTNAAATNDSLDDFGFRQGDPPVTIDAAKTDADSFCMSATGGGSTFYISDTNTRPTTTAC